MAVEARLELVGKRFLCVGGDEPPEVGDISQWSWRSGVIRAVNHRDSGNPDLTAFKPVVGKSLLKPVIAVEFLLDRQLDFLTDNSAYQPYQDELDSQNPVLRDNHQLHEEVKCWLKEQKVQEIFLQGPYSLNGYRVRVYRQDSATQWFTGIITHHDLFSRNMVVMNDQVLEPQNVDPSMIQMTFLDDVVHSLLKGENIGITSRRRSRSSQNNNAAHSHYTRARANSPRPVMTSSGPSPKSSQGILASQQSCQSQQSLQPASQLHSSLSSSGREQKEQHSCRTSRRKSSDSSVPEEDKDKREETTGRNSKLKAKQAVNKRKRNCEEDEKKAGVKHLRIDITSDLSESSDSENTHKSTVHFSYSSSLFLSSSSSSSSSSSEPNSENDLKSHSNNTKLNILKKDDKPLRLQSINISDSATTIDQLSPWVDFQETEQNKKADKETGKMITKEEEELVAVTQITQLPQQQIPLMCDSLQGSIIRKNIVKGSSESQTPSLTHLHSGSVIDVTDDAQATVHKESSEAVSALLASQKAESTSPYLPLNLSPVSSPLIPQAPSPSEGSQRADIEAPLQQQVVTGSGVATARTVDTMDLASTEVIRLLASDNDNGALKTVIPHHFQHLRQHPHYTSIQNSMTSQFIPCEIKKMQQPQINMFFSSDEANSKLIPNPSLSTELQNPLKHKLQYASNSQFQSIPITTNIFHSKPHSGQLDILKPKPNISPEITKHNIPKCSDTSSLPISRLLTKTDTAKPMRSGFKSGSPQPETSSITACSGSSKNPLIIDKNDTFIVYRDPALVTSHSDNYTSPAISSSHMASYLHPHLRTLHSTSPHSPCLYPSHPHAASHLLASPHASSLPHSHLLPSGVLPAMLSPAASIRGGHPRLDSPSGLGQLTLPQAATAHQQQFLPGQGPPPHPLLAQTNSGGAGLGLYPILWPYPNGTSSSYSPSLNLAPTAKWVHPENHVTMNSEVSIRRNTASPWLPQSAGSTADGLVLLSHGPMRPASADAYQPAVEIGTHTSASLSKASNDIPKETLISQRKEDHTKKKKTLTGKDNSLHHLYTDPLSKARLANKKDSVQAADQASTYKEENRQILKESIEVAPFTAKIHRISEPVMDKDRERCRDAGFLVRTPVLPCQNVKGGHAHGIQSDKSNYFTTLSTTVVNEPSRLYPLKDFSSFYDKMSAGASVVVGSVGATVSNQGSLSLVYSRCKSSLSKPPPLIRHQSEGGEGLAGKITEQLSHKLTIVQKQHHTAPNQHHEHIRAMPSLHRAPVFHPPTQHALECKEAIEQEEREQEREQAAYGGCLSPPTLTPIQPVSYGSSGYKTLAEQQKPPTLLPEFRDVKGHGNTAVLISVSSSVSEDVMTSSADDWRGGEILQDKGMPRNKPQAIMASVIVCPSTSIKYESVVGANKLSSINYNDLSQRRVYSSCKEPEATSVFQPSSKCNDMSAQYKKTGVQGVVGTNSIDSVSVAPYFCKQVKTQFSSAHEEILADKTGSYTSSMLNYSPTGEELASTYISSEGSLPPPSPAEISQPSPSLTTTCNLTSVSSQPYSFSFVHQKKHKATVAAAPSRTNLFAPTTVMAGNSSSVDSAEKIHSSSIHASFTSGESSSSFLNGSTTPDKSSPLPNGHASGSASSSSGHPINYHKLKKAWLTRHSEEDRNMVVIISSTTGKMDKDTTTDISNPTAMSEMIKPCTVNLSASTSCEIEMGKEKFDRERQAEEKVGGAEARKTPLRRGNKRTYDSGSESCGYDSDASESKTAGRAKRQPKPTYKKKQNDLAKKKGDTVKEDDDIKPNGIFRSAREKTKLKLASNNGIPRSILKDWRKVKKLKQTGESFLQDDSCCEIGPNLQKCRECRVIRNKKGEEPVHSPVFCRFYYFRRLSYSKNGVIRIDGFSNPDQFDDEALSLWDPGVMQNSFLDKTTATYILSFIGDKFCQMVVTENTAAAWVKKDTKLAWKRAVRGVREMCDACEVTIFNIHWVCQKCGFVVCLDCFKAKERRSSKDKELYSWLKCVKGQPHDHKHLMPTQVIPGTVLTELVKTMHTLREKYCMKPYCPCPNKQSFVKKLTTTNGVSQVLQNVLNHSNKLPVVKSELGSHEKSDQGGMKLETNGGGNTTGNDPGSSPITPPESQSPLHFLADLAEQKSREEKKENKEAVLLAKSLKEENKGDSLEVLQQCKAASLVANSTEQGSTLRDLLTTTAGKLKLGSTDAGIAFAPVYSPALQTGKGGRTVPNILDDIIASVVENKIPASRQNINSKMSVKHEPLTIAKAISNSASTVSEEAKSDKKELGIVVTELTDDSTSLYQTIPFCWLNNKQLLWLKDHRNQNNWKMFRECWKQGQPVLVSGIHKRLNASLWKADSFNQEFADHQGDLFNCKDQVVSNSGIKEFWDGFEDITKRPKSKDGEPMVYKLKDWPSGEEFMALMPSRYDDLMKNLPLPEYSDPEGNLNLASYLPSFFVRPDLGPRLSCAYGVAASKEQDFGTANLHLEVSDVVSVLVYVGVAKGNGVLSKTGVLKRLEEEDLDEGFHRRLKDSSETPGALWHIYLNKDMDQMREFLHKLCKEQGLDLSLDQDPIREQSFYLSRKQRRRLLDEHGVQGWTVVQFLGDSVLIPAGAMHQVQNLHSCVQVINDFVSPEHVAKCFSLTQELRSSKDQVNYEDKLQVKNILYHCVKEVVSALKRDDIGEGNP
uniref:Probable JmjC domain-containing histone demethylation protein 2C n=1 Tax=Takifugu rubripes TaxID=31033 RepID=A0A674MWP9_TAKRU